MEWLPTASASLEVVYTFAGQFPPLTNKSIGTWLEREAQLRAASCFAAPRDNKVLHQSVLNHQCERSRNVKNHRYQHKDEILRSSECSVSTIGETNHQ